MKTIDANMILGRPGSHQSGVLTTGELLAEMDVHGIDRALVTHLAGAIHDAATGNDLLMRAMGAGDDTDRLVPVPVVYLETGDGGLDWDAWEALGARGVRACPGYYRPATGRTATDELLARLERRGWFLQVPLRPFGGSPRQTASVADAVSLAEMQPAVPVLILCPTRKEFAELCIALESRSNVHVDAGNLTTGTGVADLVARGFADRLVCGSGFGVSCSTPFRDVVEYSPVPEWARRAILHDTAARLIEGRTAKT